MDILIWKTKYKLSIHDIIDKKQHRYIPFNFVNTHSEVIGNIFKKLHCVLVTKFTPSHITFFTLYSQKTGTKLKGLTNKNNFVFYLKVIECKTIFFILKMLYPKMLNGWALRPTMLRE